MGPGPIDKDADADRIARYVEGELTLGERIAFEIRLANEPALARAFEEYDRADRYLASLPAAAFRRPARLRLAWQVGLAAAAVAAVGSLLMWQWRSSRAAPAFDAFVLATGVKAPTYLQHLGLEPGLAVYLERLRGGGESQPSEGGMRDPAIEAQIGTGSSADPLRRIRDAEKLRLEAAFRSSPAPIRAEYFVIPFHPAATCSALVVTVDAKGQAARSFPSGTPASAPLPRFEGGRTHFIPKEPVALGQNKTGAPFLSYEEGFLVPDKGGPLRVVLAVRREPFDAALLGDLDAWLSGRPWLQGGVEDPAAAASRGAAAWLDGRGFTSRSFEVHEP